MAGTWLKTPVAVSGTSPPAGVGLPPSTPSDELALADGFAFVVRGIVRPARVPANVVWITGRPPFPVGNEVALLKHHEIEALFVQASGGEVTYPKIAAARALGLPVVMLTRPQPPEGAAGSVPEALAWLAGVLGRRGGRSTCE